MTRRPYTAIELGRLGGNATRPTPTMRLSVKLALKTVIAMALLTAVSATSLRAEIIYWPLTALDLAKQRATGINCVGNLRQISLAGRLWSSENGDRCPSKIQDFTNH